MSSTISLATIDKVDPTELILGGGLDILKDELQHRFDKRPLDAETEDQRKEVISFAMKFSKDSSLVAGICNNVINAKSKLIEDQQIELSSMRRMLKDFKSTCTELRKSAREPVTLWEEAKKEEIRLEELNKQKEIDEEDAYKEDELYTLRAKQAEYEAQEAARKATEEQEARIKQEAEKAARDAAQRVEQQAQAKIAEAKEAEERAKRQAAEAEARAKAEYEQKELQRLAEEQRIRDEEADRQANVNHQMKINNKAWNDICIVNHLSEDKGLEIIKSIIKGQIRNVNIQY